MTAALQIITDAFRESNIIPENATPNTQQVTDGLRRLQNLINSAAGFDVGSSLREWPVGAGGYTDSMSGWSSAQWAYPQANVRLVTRLDSAQTIYMPFQPRDGARLAVVDSADNLGTYNLTLDGNGRTVENAATAVLATNGMSRSWMYRADLGDWVRVANLADEDAEMPFPEEFDDYFTIKLAMRVNPRYGRSLAAESTARLQEMETAIKARYRQRRNIHADTPVLAQNKRRMGRAVDPYNPGFGE